MKDCISSSRCGSSEHSSQPEVLHSNINQLDVAHACQQKFIDGLCSVLFSLCIVRNRQLHNIPRVQGPHQVVHSCNGRHFSSSWWIDVLVSWPVHTIAEKWDSLTKVRQFHFCETVSLLCDSLTFLRQCGQGFTVCRQNSLQNASNHEVKFKNVPGS